MLTVSSAPRMVARSGTSSSLSFQILVILAVGVLLPSLPFGSYSGGTFGYQSPAWHTVIGSLIASASAAILLRRFSDFPGTETFHYTLPIYSAAYGITIAAILGLRLDYSNSILSVVFITSLVVQYLLMTFSARFGGVNYHVVPGGRMDEVRLPNDLPVKRMVAPGVPRGRGGIIVADLHHDHDPAWERAIAQAALNDIPVYHYKQVWEALTGRVQIEHLSENSFGSLLPSMPYRKIKRLTDLALCAILLPVLIVPMLAVGVLIRFDSPGSALFRQTRMGHRGQTFEVFKFRTMRIASDPEACQLTAAMTQHDDARVTRVGRFLRRSRLDELPQMINVWRGEMSWIGPRPEAIALSNWYQSEIPFYSYRHIVRPGITGWAQVNQGHVTDIGDVHAKLQYDFFYIKNFSHWIDMLILIRTARVMLSGFGAK